MINPIFKKKSKKRPIIITQDKIEELISKLTLEEKVALCSGKDVWNTKPIHRLDIPSMAMADGPHGVRKQLAFGDNIGLFESLPSTCFPTASALAASWNRGLIREIGVALAKECQHLDINMLLGPGINIKRSPLCGRNFEYFSEDPYLSAELGISMVNAVQSKGVSACLKHFAVNNQEKYRMTIDAVVDDRALQEIYLFAFNKVIAKSNPWAVMVSYNKLNGEYTSESDFLIKNTLRHKWGYKGVVVTDWGATNDRVLALNSGVDLEMPSSGKIHDPLIIKAIKSNQLPIEKLDETVRRNLTLLFRTKENMIPGFRYSRIKHHLLARKAASESIVLLKNESVSQSLSSILNIPNRENNDNFILPLKSGVSVALIGQFAKHPRYQGAGSSHINPTQLENLYHIAKSDLKDNLTYAKGYSKLSKDIDLHLLQEAKDVASHADVVILMVGLTDSFESEGFDRIHMKLPMAHEALIREISSSHSSVVVVLSNGAPVEMPWIEKVPCIVEAYLSGQAGAAALWDILTGKVNPSGKIAESFPLTLEQASSSPYYPMGPESVEYRESIFVGYRFYEKFNQPVLFPFGHGLSYTTFEYSGLSMENNIFDFDSKDKYFISLTIKNIGNCSGMEIIQLYISDISGRIIRPKKELKGFKKVNLRAKEKTDVLFFLEKSDFSYYSTLTNNFDCVNGNHSIIIGSSSKDIKLEAVIELRSSQMMENIRKEKDGTGKKLGNGITDAANEFDINRELEINKNSADIIIDTKKDVHVRKVDKNNDKAVKESEKKLNSAFNKLETNKYEVANEFDTKKDVSVRKLDINNDEAANISEFYNDMEINKHVAFNDLENDYYNTLIKNRLTTRNEFYRLLGKPLPISLEEIPIHHINTTMGECQNHWLCRLMYKAIMYKIKKLTKGNKMQQETMKMVLLDLPLRGLALMSNGTFTYKHLDALILWLNKRRFRALGALFLHK